MVATPFKVFVREMFGPIIFATLTLVFCVITAAVWFVGGQKLILVRDLQSSGISVVGKISDFEQHYSYAGKFGVGHYDWWCSVDYLVGDETYTRWNVDGVTCDPQTGSAFQGQLVTLQYSFTEPTKVSANLSLTKADGKGLIFIGLLQFVGFIWLLWSTIKIARVRLGVINIEPELKQLIKDDNPEGVMNLLTRVSTKPSAENLGALAMAYFNDKPVWQDAFIAWFKPVVFRHYKPSSDTDLMLTMKVNSLVVLADSNFYNKIVISWQGLLSDYALIRLAIKGSVELLKLDDTHVDISVIEKQKYTIQTLLQKKTLSFSTVDLTFTSEAKFYFLQTLLIKFCDLPVHWLAWAESLIDQKKYWDGPSDDQAKKLVAADWAQLFEYVPSRLKYVNESAEKIQIWDMLAPKLSDLNLH